MEALTPSSAWLAQDDGDWIAHVAQAAAAGAWRRPAGHWDVLTAHGAASRGLCTADRAREEGCRLLRLRRPWL